MGKIAVTIERPERDSSISEVFGRSFYFLIYDQEKELEEILRNPFATELGGAGIQSARFLIEQGVDIVIVNKIGTNPFRFLTSANIKIYECREGNGVEALQLFREERLNQLESSEVNFSIVRKRKRLGRNYLDKQ